MATAASWSRLEIEAIVDHYFHMLTQELAGQAYSKTEHRRALAARLNGRNDGSIERKHQNISEVLIELRSRYERASARAFATIPRPECRGIS